MDVCCKCCVLSGRGLTKLFVVFPENSVTVILRSCGAGISFVKMGSVTLITLLTGRQVLSSDALLISEPQICSSPEFRGNRGSEIILYLQAK
jgi:hypothetical protein